MKMISSLIILGLCVNVCYSTLATTSQSGSLSSSILNSTATKVYSAANQTDAAIWDGYALTTPGTNGVPSSNVWFGPGTGNTTSYVYGLTTASNAVTAIYKRTLNDTVVGWGNDTTEASVSTTDATITCTAPATTFAAGVGPGYFALLSQGSDGTNKQIYVNLVSGTTATQTKITTTLDIVSATQSATAGCTTTTFGVGNIWYDMGATAFFYTYYKTVNTYTGATAGTTCGSTSPTVVNTIYLGGMYVNGTAYWTSPLSIAASTAANSPATSTLMGGGDNQASSANIYVVYKDSTMTTPTTYVSKTVKNTTTTSAGSFSTLVADVTTSGATKTFVPIGVWASAYTYGIGVSNQTETATTPAYSYTITNYLNGSTTGTDSGLSYTSVTTASAGATTLSGWALTTGYTLVGGWITSTTPMSYQIGTFYANGTANMTATTLATIQGPINFYEDVNGTQWVGWTDVDTTNSKTYAGYLAKLQGQTSTGSSANVLSTLLAFAALCLASVLAF